MITVSVVSHGHGSIVEELLHQLICNPLVHSIVLTCNIPEPPVSVVHPKIQVVWNPSPLGFGANHNAAFRNCNGPYYCVMNPDILLQEDPFPSLLAAIQRYDAALVAPKICSPQGIEEDSIRSFPTLPSLLAKIVLRHRGIFTKPHGTQIFFPDWVAGMFHLFKSTDFSAVSGYDPAFYMYYEDVDICRRLRMAQKKILADMATMVVHDARRASHHNVQHFFWHLRSACRYLVRYYFQ